MKRKPFLHHTSLPQDLTSRTLDIVQKTGLDYYAYNEQNQIGTSFGERFINAISDIYEKGYDAVITIGNDTPNLGKTHLLKAIESVQKGQSVIGPSFDGGFYLMGLHKEAFHYQKFSEFSWNTATVRKELYAYLESHSTSFSQLDFLHDLDHITDAIKVYKALPFFLKKIRRIVQKLLQQEKAINTTLLVNVSFVFFSIHFNKGSPTVMYRMHLNLT